MPERDDISRKTVSRLRNFSKRLESGEPIHAVEVTIERTPDGPLTTRREVDYTDRFYTDYGGEG